MKKLHVDSVTKSYQNKVVLSDVYLSCNRGECVGLVGRNGAGKSTLLKIIFGSEKADTKFVRVGDRVIKGISDGRNLINYLPQENFLPQGVRIRTLVEMFLSTERKASLLEHDFMKPLLHKKNRELSGGEKRIVEIMLLLHSRADFILMDEPFNGLSPKMREYVSGAIKALNPGKGYLITDHDYRNVINISDRIVFLHNGYLRELKNTDDLVRHGYLSEGQL